MASNNGSIESHQQNDWFHFIVVFNIFKIDLRFDIKGFYLSSKYEEFGSYNQFFLTLVFVYKMFKRVAF